MKANQSPNLTMVSPSTTKHLIIPFRQNIPNHSAHPSQPQKKPFFSEGRIEEELLKDSSNTPLAKKVKAKLLQKRTPHNIHILAIPNEMIKVFLHLPKKQTKRSNKKSPPLSKPINSVNSPSKTCQIKNLTFLRTLIL